MVEFYVVLSLLFSVYKDLLWIPIALIINICFQYRFGITNKLKIAIGISDLASVSK